MIVIFVALRTECLPISARLSDRAPLPGDSFQGYRGRVADVPVAVVVTGMGMRRSRISSARALDSLPGIDLVMTCGVAGGLRDDLEVGQVVVGERLLTCREDDFQPEQIVASRPELLGRCIAALKVSRRSFAVGPMLTSRRAIATSIDKRRAHLESGGAISVDMESAVIALESERRGLPFVCLRTILDTAAEDVAGAGLVDNDGRVRPLAAAKALFTNPRTVVGVVRLVRNLRLATQSLGSTLEALLPSLQ
jgi:adenosylhomocysteine nucleosidase